MKQDRFLLGFYGRNNMRILLAVLHLDTEDGGTLYTVNQVQLTFVIFYYETRCLHDFSVFVFLCYDQQVAPVLGREEIRLNWIEANVLRTQEYTVVLVRPEIVLTASDKTDST